MHNRFNFKFLKNEEVEVMQLLSTVILYKKKLNIEYKIFLFFKMWFEILPSFGIICVVMAVPHASAYLINNLLVGNMYRRTLLEKDNRRQYLRDRRLTGNPYKVQGLEAIPDE
ncbi:unnamed protein product [Psylliodes chrysocephalus]|uniref:NADH dehydrogenase [ubiquinone] 1 alpha subcomplex subunit 1 n=1 Tax=Psylliodes chrysocephalus TaxID=3402493 RepID=A0A9P0CPN4_9CUCU|nr:unnamed protein product [Psylliodes chrysocephala]